MEKLEFISKFKEITAHCVYRLINDEGIVIYVGSSSSPSNRVYAHSRSEKVFSTVGFDLFDSFHDLAKNEAIQIATHSPEFNNLMPGSGEFITLRDAQELMASDIRRLTRNLPRVFCRGKTSYLSNSEFNEFREVVLNEALLAMRKANDKQSVVNEMIMAKYKKVTK